MKFACDGLKLLKSQTALISSRKKEKDGKMRKFILAVMILGLFCIAPNVTASDMVFPMNSNVSNESLLPPVSYYSLELQNMIIFKSVEGLPYGRELEYWTFSSGHSKAICADSGCANGRFVIYYQYLLFVYDWDGFYDWPAFIENSGRSYLLNSIEFSSIPIYDVDETTIVREADVQPLAVIIDPPTAGNVTVDNVACTTCPCQFTIPVNDDAIIEAIPTDCNWSFVRFEWNDGANSSTENPLTLNMDSAMTVKAVFRPILQFPLSGTLGERKLTHFYWGDTWTYGECPTGTYKKHIGVDLYAAYGEGVDAAHDGIVKKIYTGQHSLWADAIVIESNDGKFTTVYWHVIKYGNLAENDTVTKGQQVATIAYLPDNTHFHFGIRMAPYSDPESYAGALPVADGCNYLAFPEKFIDPEAAIYE